MTTDTLKLAQALRRAGHSSEVAEGTAAAVAEFVDQGAAGLATKGDLADLRSEIKADLAELRAELQREMREQAWKIAGLLLVQTGAIIALIKLL